ncbi:DUF3307 domain-containing protein [Synechococcus lacustris]|jgi:hypothetical protein|uniref:DUF3307 domain-containing protein n=1 Tax=Synechococcus lacustris TaxID=2116544 RepID=UPI0020CCD82F|nr:DUF3307 domain-containing protein [Synechococcus lacustris]MCP9923374.1 DUF3307 domain-containing protein [Synechococcus lacustris Cruz CV12-2]
MAFINLLLLLLMGHFLGDFALQNGRMAREKCPGPNHSLPWGYWLTAHGAIHGLIVALLTGIPLLGLAEWLVHMLIDWGKCRNFYRLPVDQSLHLASKAIWALLALVVFAV